MSTTPITFIDDDPILFVDDNAICCLETTATLRDLGYTVVNAYDADGAFDALSRKSPLRALVTDIDLGPGPDGFEVARIARGAYPALAVVFISGTAASRHHSEGVSGSEFVSKPFLPYQIAEALNRAIAA
jgi:CheY-like chemotaxis protein